MILCSMNELDLGEFASAPREVVGSHDRPEPKSSSAHSLALEVNCADFAPIDKHKGSAWRQGRRLFTRYATNDNYSPVREVEHVPHVENERLNAQSPSSLSCLRICTSSSPRPSSF